MRTLPDQISEVVGPGDNILLQCPVLLPAGSLGCVDLLTVEPPSQENVLAITFTETPSNRIELCEMHVDGHPGNAAIIDVAASNRSLPDKNQSKNESTELRNTITIDTISSPTNLTGIGVNVTNKLDDWQINSSDRQIVGCLHSITALLQYVDQQEAFRFLDALTDTFTKAGAITHFHIDPHAHDKQTIRQFMPLFDIACEYENHEWTLRR